MQKLSAEHSMYLKAKRDRNGCFYGGSFKEEHANEDPYPKCLFAYIHLNIAKLYTATGKK